MTFYGTEGKTGEVLITSTGFEEGLTYSTEVWADNVGDINKIILRNGGSDNY